jgi:hypothetical protein
VSTSLEPKTQPSAAITQQGSNLIDRAGRLFYRVGETGNGGGRSLRVQTVSEKNATMHINYCLLKERMSWMLKFQDLTVIFMNIDFGELKAHLDNLCR